MRSDIKFIIPVLLLIMSFQFVSNERWQFFNGSFNPEQIARVEKRPVNFLDTIPNDTIYVCFSKKNIPLAFYREIQSGVCLEGVCLPVYLNIYWTVSGNYLGYKLGEGEILTKNEHEPFTAHDYKELHILLSDPQSLLANFSIEEMTQGKADTAQVDGISGATLSNLRGYIVTGAAYTTHTLWHITYGANRDSVLNLSSDYVSLPLLLDMFKSKDMQDKVWALGHVNDLGQEMSQAIPQVRELIKSDNFYIKEKALAALTSLSLPDSLIQRALFETFLESDFGAKRLIVNGLSEYSSLSETVVEKFIRQLPNEKDAIISLVFNLFKETKTVNATAVHQISCLLDHEHNFLSRSAFSYLSSLEVADGWLKEKLDKYQKETR